MRKTGPDYPAAVFNPKKTPPWELAIILESESNFAAIRREASHWMKKAIPIAKGF
jgi:hypothetical protein